ncbi:MAG TPA: glycerate kinase [Trebonia sp.]
MNHVVIAPDKFKGTLTASEVATYVTAGLASAGVRDDSVVAVPIADGGDGTVDAALAAGYQRIGFGVRGPSGPVVNAAFAVRDGTAIIESAQACGLALLAGGELAPLTASTWGVGELVQAAVRMGAKQVVLGLGGTATTDGGAGFARALGARLADSEGRDLPAGGAALGRLASLDLTGLRDLSGVEFLLASDVDNPLLGPAGAAAVYAPQKGASPDDVAVLEEGLARWADVAEGALGRKARDLPGAGAAGGLGFAAQLFLGARTRPGIGLLLEMTAFEERLAGARLVITGEGALDEQTLRGKAPAGVARAAAAHDPSVPAVAVCGVCLLSAAQLREAGLAQAYALTDIEPDLAKCLASPGPILEQLAARIADDWLS